MAALLKKRALAEFTQTVKVEVEDDYLPLKKLKLPKKQWNSSSSGTAFIGMLSKCKSSNEALQLLLRVSETTLGIQCTDIPEAIKKLVEHLQVEKESAVRAKILNLFADLGELDGADVLNIIDETIEHIKTERSHKVVAQGLSTLLHLGRNIQSQHPKLIQISKQFLKDTNNIVKCKCLNLIGAVLPICENNRETLELVANFSYSEDARVRSAALSTLVVLFERKQKLDVGFYKKACDALKDDYEIVRLSALNLIGVLSQTYGEETVYVKEEPMSLIDDAFSKVCLMVTDLSMRVRTVAITMLGNMKNVSPKLLQQTLDKKLMSNMRLKISAHERSKANVTSGEWATGAKWASDAPRELLKPEGINLIASGSCGALVHGLEDEFQEVRSAGVDTLCNLSLDNPEFAILSLDFLVDMFNDEIESVRLKAIESLTKISCHIILREDQLETILGALKDFSLEVREGLHGMLSACRLSTKDCLQMTVESLLDNLKKYPQDKKSIWRCFQKVGDRHPELTLPLVPELLAIHPFFDTPEPDVEDPLYICVLILIFNAAKNCPTMGALFEEHTVKHYRYLRDTMPNLVPQLKLKFNEDNMELPFIETGSREFLAIILENVKNAPSTRVRVELMRAAQKFLMAISESDINIGGAPIFLSLYINCQLLMQKILQKKFSPLSTYEPNTVLKLLQISLQLQYCFTNLTDVQIASMKQLKLKALCVMLVKVVKGNSSALSLCHYFLTTVDGTQRYLASKGILPEPWTRSLFKELSLLEDNKPGVVARVLLPLINTIQPNPPPPCLDFNISMCKAVISDPTDDADTTVKFTAGLIGEIPFDAEITSLSNVSVLRIKVKYPDQNTILVLPNKSDLRPINKNEGNTDYRLLTSVLLSHQVWTEACYVDISLALELAGEEGLCTPGNKTLLPTEIDPYVIDLCKPVKVYVSPKPVKRGI
ncbi:hypothetical protein RUM43_000976 [Polyplax serrata]|uniref:Integrator complex subunit 4 n=1 Tax=Polyplax serrata TaxID=468196 RepID=A0AAN8XNX3_POLSC